MSARLAAKPFCILVHFALLAAARPSGPSGDKQSDNGTLSEQFTLKDTSNLPELKLGNVQGRVPSLNQSALLSLFKSETLDEDTDDVAEDMEYNAPGNGTQDSVIPPPGLSLNVSGLVGGRMRPPPTEAPEYMMDLYNRFAQGRVIQPTSNIVRSFMNINIEDTVPVPEREGEQLEGTATRVHKLIFNITSISAGEVVDYSQLRLYKLVQRDRNTYAGVDRKVYVLEVLGSELPESQKYRLIATRHIYGHQSGWESFDVTSAVRRWLSNPECRQILEIRIESLLQVETQGDMDIDVNPEHKNEPLLVVFSNDLSKVHLHQQEMRELEAHEPSSDVADEEEEGDGEEGEEEDLELRQQINSSASKSRLNVRTNSTYNVLSRSRRSYHKKRKGICRRYPMYVNFVDIDWQSWVIAPAGYQAFECAGRCYIPLSDHLTPTKHALIQTLMHKSHPKLATRACCVPTMLNPISILYLDDNGVITYKYRYDDMVVEKCGCR